MISNLSLSKSKLLDLIKCQKLFWLRTHNQILYQNDPQKEFLFKRGRLVEKKAQTLFGDGPNIFNETNNFSERINLTKKYISDNCFPIFEATFQYEGLLVMVDVLTKSENGFEIFEIKSGSIKAKDDPEEHFIMDLAIQTFVLKNIGIELSKASLVFINSDYVREEHEDLSQLFVSKNVLNQTFELHEDIRSYIDESKMVKQLNNCPNIDIGRHCKKPYTCDAYDLCWQSIPEYSVFNIFPFRKGSKANRAMELREVNILNVQDVPIDNSLTKTQRKKIELEKKIQEKDIIIDTEEVKNFLNSLNYPIYHLDFETYQSPIPKFPGTKPYQQIPFQFSLHIEDENHKLIHREFLAKDQDTDERKKLIIELTKHIPNLGGTVLAFNSSFEKSRINELATAFPEFKEHLDSINHRMLDLAVLFEKKYIYKKDMIGSYSIKKILPSLVKDHADAYKKLQGVKNGGDASRTFLELSDQAFSEQDILDRRRNLLDYCKLDTKAMVEILKFVRQNL